MKKQIGLLILIAIHFTAFSQKLEQRFEFYFRLTKSVNTSEEITALYANRKNVENVWVSGNEIKVTAICKDFKEQDMILKKIKDWAIENHCDIAEYKKKNLSVNKETQSLKKK